MTTDGRTGDNRKRGSNFLKTLLREPSIFAVYAAVTVFMTWPAVTLTSRTYAEARDPMGAIWWLWWLRYSFFERIAVSPVSIVGVPSGLNLSPYKADPLYNLITRVLSIISTETAAYNIVLLLSYLLTGITAYYLVRYVTRKRSAAAFSGLVMAFCPYMLMQGKEHLGLISVFWIPAFFLLLIKAWFDRSLPEAIGCGALFIALTLYNYQYGFIAGTSAAVFIATLWLSGMPWKNRHGHAAGLMKFIPVLVVVLVAVALIFVLFSRSSADMKRELSEVVKYSARPWDYVLPHAEGRAFGYLSRGFIKANLHGGTLVENSLFLGYVPMLLALFAVIWAWLDAARTRRRGKAGGVDAAEVKAGTGDTVGATGENGAPREVTGYTNRMVLSFSACGAFAFIASMPPSFSLFGVKVYMPSYLFHAVVPQFRACARFGVIVMFCVAVLCGFAVSRILESAVFKDRKALVVTILSVLALLEFTIVPPFRSLDTNRTTDYYRWLEAQPGKPVVAIYPLFYLDSFDTYEYFFQQRFHKKPMVNGADPEKLEENYRQSIMDIKNPMTPSLLKGLGTKYVLIIPSRYKLPFGWYMNYPFPTEFDFGGMPPGLKEVREFNECAVFEVTAGEPDFIPLFGQGFYQLYLDPEGKVWHPAVEISEISIDSKPAEPVECRIRFEVMTARAGSNLKIRLNGGEVASADINQQPGEITINNASLNPGINKLELFSDGSRYSLTEIPGYDDVWAAIMVSDIQVVRINE